MRRWGPSWVAESLADFNSEFNTTGSPIVEEDEEDEDDVVSLASTAPNLDMVRGKVSHVVHP